VLSSISCFGILSSIFCGLISSLIWFELRQIYFLKKLMLLKSRNLIGKGKKLITQTQHTRPGADLELDDRWRGPRLGPPLMAKRSPLNIR
jgi:hypothetical protein